MSDAVKDLAYWIGHFDAVNEARWGEDDKEPPTWEQVRDSMLSDWKQKDMSFEFWSSYVTGMIIEAGRQVVWQERLASD